MKQPECIQHHDNRFYKVGMDYYPSATTILGVVSKPGLEKWKGEVGNEAAQEKMEAAADSGTLIHSYCERISRGEEVDLVGLGVNDARKVAAFGSYLRDSGAEIALAECTIYSVEFGFAGTLDTVLRVDGKLIVSDTKTGSGIWPTYKMQIAAYCHALNEMDILDEEVDSCQILHLNSTKRGYTIKDVEDWRKWFDGFLAAKQLWDLLHPNAKPEFVELPTKISWKNPGILLDPYAEKDKVST